MLVTRLTNSVRLTGLERKSSVCAGMPFHIGEPTVLVTNVAARSISLCTALDATVAKSEAGGSFRVGHVIPHRVGVMKIYCPLERQLTVNPVRS